MLFSFLRLLSLLKSLLTKLKFLIFLIFFLELADFINKIKYANTLQPIVKQTNIDRLKDRSS